LAKIKQQEIMKFYSKDEYKYLTRNGCYPDGYVDGLGLVSSRTVTVRSTSPSYPNERTLGIERRTQFISSIQVPVIVPLIPPKAKKATHEEVTALLKTIIEENTTMPAFSPELKVMVYKLKEKIKEKQTGNYAKIREAKAELEKDPHNRKAHDKIRKAEEENAALSEVEREIRTLATSNQPYDLLTNYSFKGGPENAEYLGGFEYESDTGHAELRFSANKPSLGEFAHELKHAYQFETGTLSGHSNKREGSLFYSLYDKEDEREAFARGQLFGLSETFERNAAVYDHIPDSRDFSEAIRKSKSKEVHKWRNWSATVVSIETLHGYEMILRDPRATPKEKEDAEKELLDISKKTKTAFRVNGKTYFNGKIIHK
jgi:hypothetical protein